MGTHDINVHIYPYLKIKMDKKTDTKFIQKLKTHARRKTTFHFRLPQNFFHSPNSLPPNETKNLSLGAKQKRKKKKKTSKLGWNRNASRSNIHGTAMSTTIDDRKIQSAKIERRFE